MEQEKLKTDPYKGVRDFYPHDFAIQQAIFDVMRKAATSFGYEEYNASVLEPAELYRAKSGEEIVNEQTYTFKDRGDREVTLRPEMTPTVARLVAAQKRELAFPLRWFSIPNLFRYEKPQRGRLREHWQLNVDIFGVKSIQAEIEVISLAASIMRAYGMKDSEYEIRINNRKIVRFILDELYALPGDIAHQVGKAIDRKEKMTTDEFKSIISELFAKVPTANGAQTDERVAEFLTLLNSQNFEEFIRHIGETHQEHEGIAEIKAVIAGLNALGVTNAVFSQTLMRGFDYYTGIVFEVFDKNPENRRSLFGGGRYDDLLSLFGNETVPAFGFGMGDVTIRDVLETYGRLPAVKAGPDVYICVMEESCYPFVQTLAHKIRTGEHGYTVAIDYSNKRIGDQIKSAEKHGASHVIVVGGNEMTSGSAKIKNLSTGDEREISLDSAASLAL